MHRDPTGDFITVSTVGGETVRASRVHDDLRYAVLMNLTPHYVDGPWLFPGSREQKAER